LSIEGLHDDLLFELKVHISSDDANKHLWKTDSQPAICIELDGFHIAVFASICSFQFA